MRRPLRRAEPSRADTNSRIRVRRRRTSLRHGAHVRAWLVGAGPRPLRPWQARSGGPRDQVRDRAWPFARAQGPVRRLLRASPALKRRARSSARGPSSGRAGAFLYRATGFDAAAARTGLENSLRELGTDYVDLFLLHDPEPGSVGGDDACGFLEDARRSGKIRAWGVAGEVAPSVAVARALPVPPPVLQLRDDILAARAPELSTNGAQQRITFGALGTIGDLVSHVGADPARRRRWWQRREPPPRPWPSATTSAP